MSVRDLIPWNRGNNQVPSLYREGGIDPFLSLHRDVNKLFDEVFRGFGAPSLFNEMAPRNGTWPRVEFSENDREIRVMAEVPGLEEKDVEVLLEDGVLTLRGEKKSEVEDKDRQFSERYHGRFERRIGLGREIDEDKVAATFKNGLLTITLPKTEKAQANAKRIAISSEK
ncbi:Hsp20/alpha crystallin family protein (plasmid) [Phyllobacterium sp. A18/5-2]|uniref:Hsp20/alpha crystallin family protein n=1 Tax=Phyllobacterium sp. A18/5-2 TaxID=2978392 RepID=UPI0021C81288|nr:Hsp20/alpha crystallin family protein [Phyllobacterium sp. A18/5-2]UXN66051.1 Hsp20/alpha crystallin family protein [Phyllobacterium sp. A18/5-2]